MARGAFISDEDFVRAYMTHATTALIGEALKMRHTSVNARAKVLRRKGVKLPEKSRSWLTDVDGLNRLIATMQNGQASANATPLPPNGDYELTKTIADFIHRKGPQQPGAIVKACGLTQKTVVRLMAQRKYFDFERDRLSLTPVAIAEFFGKD